MLLDKIIITGLTIVMLMTSSNNFAQTSRTDPQDTEGWYSASLKLNLPRKWESNLTLEERFFNNLKTNYGTYISLGLTKKVTKYISFTGEYRIASFNYGITHRYTFGMEANKKINKQWDLGGRVLLQNRVQDNYEPGVVKDNSIFFRLRAQAKYEINKTLDIYASMEPIIKFGGNSFVDNWRNTIGLKYKLNTKTKLDIFYIYRPDYGKKSYNRLFHIVGFNLSYTLKVKEKKKVKK